MRVIFIKDLKGQGKKGEVKEVKDGYGMNFLIKKGYATMATDFNINKLNTENKIKKEEEEKLIKECENIKEEISKITLEYKVKTGQGDRVFGSISSKLISSDLKNKNIDIDKKKILLDNPLCSLGYHDVKIQLHKKVVATLKVHLIKES